MPPPPRRPAPLAASLGGGFAVGWTAGVLLLVSGLLVLPRADFWTTSPTTIHAIWVLLRSVGLYTLLAGGAGAAGAALLHPVLRRWAAAPAVMSGLLAAGILLLHLTVRWQLEELSGMPLDHPERIQGALRHTLLAFAVAVVVTAAGYRFLRRRSFARPAVWLGVVSLALLATAGLALRPASVEPAAAPRRIVLVGLDGLTFRVLSPMMAAGELPTFRRLVDEGAWGSILTYGTASSPRVWTSIATGKRVRDHGIDDFVAVAGAGYQPRPLGRRDWRSRPVWELMGEAGKKVAVVDWLMTHPAGPVDGYQVSRLDDRVFATWPEEIRAEVARILDEHPKPSGDGPGAEHDRYLAYVDRAFAVAARWLDREVDFLALYSAAADGAEHKTWREYRPAELDDRRWGDPAPGAAVRGTILPDVYRRIDRRLGELLSRLGREDLLVVVSDHGQLAARRPRVRFDLDRLLAELGWAELDGEGRVDAARSRVYPLVETAWTPVLRVNVNVAGRELRGRVSPREAPGVARRVADRLRDLRLDDGTPLFGQVELQGPSLGGPSLGGPSLGDPSLVDPAGARRADLRILHSRATWTDRFAGRVLLLDDRRLPLAEFLQINTELSGEHDHQGVVFFHGAGVRPGPIGQLVTLTAAHRVLHHLTDKIDAVDLLLPPLRRLGLIESATTLDVTPTLLYAFDLPVGRDMAGRPLADLLRYRHRVRWTGTWEHGTDEDGEAGEAGERNAGDEEVLERLRSLGYLQ